MPSLKHILILSTIEHDPWGASEHLWSKAAHLWLAEGHSVTIYRLIQEKEPPQAVLDLVQAGAKLTDAPRYTRLRPRSLFKKLHKLPKADLALINLTACPWGGELMRACSKQQLPYAIVMQNFLEDRNAMYQDELLRKGYQAAVTTYVLNPRIGEMLRHRYRLPDLPYQVVQNPHRGIEATYPPSDNGYHIGCVARLHAYQKNQEILLHILAQTVWRSRPIHLHFFGDGPAHDDLQFWVKHYQLPNVTFHGHVSDPQELWEQLHLMVMPSRYEGGSAIVTTECMWSGRPCLTTRCNAYHIKHNINGFISDGFNIEGFGEALEQAWDQRHTWEKLGQQAQKDVQVRVGRNPEAVLAHSLLELTRNL